MRFRGFCARAISTEISCTDLNEPRHEISNNMAFWNVWAQTSLCSFLSSLELQMMYDHKLDAYRILKRQVKALIRLRVCAGWSESLLVAHTSHVAAQMLVHFFDIEKLLNKTFQLKQTIKNNHRLNIILALSQESDFVALDQQRRRPICSYA